MKYTNAELKKYIEEFDIEIRITSIIRDYSVYDVNDIIEEPNNQINTTISTQTETELLRNEKITIDSPLTKKYITLDTNVSNEVVLKELKGFITNLIKDQKE